MPQNLINAQVAQIAVRVKGADLPIWVMNNLFEAEVESTLGLPSMFTLRFYDYSSNRGGFELIDGGILNVGDEVQIDLEGGDSPGFQKVFKGEITAIEPEFDMERGATLTVRGYDKGHRLNRGAKTRVFVNVTDSDIVNKIAKVYGLQTQVDSTSQVYEHVYQDDQTDYAFLHERARRIGYVVYVDDRKLCFKKQQMNGDVVDLVWGENLISFYPRATLAQQVNKVTVRDWDFKAKKEVVGTAETSSVQPSIGLGEWGGAAAQSALSSGAEHLEVRATVATEAEAAVVAQAILDEVNANYIEAEGLAYGDPKLLAGTFINVGNVGNKFSGKYKVTLARHMYTPERGYETYFTVEGTRPEQIADLVGERARSLWGGVYPAIVTNNKDPQNHSRVKVKFPWLTDTEETAWARIASVGAGTSRGLYWLPEVNDEVLVAFEHGDFNRPYILGGLWNGQDAAPQTAEETVQNGKVEVRTLKTRAGHTIRFTDTAGSEKIEIIDAKSETQIVMDTASKKISITSKGDVEVTTTGNTKVNATGDISLDSKANINLKATAMLKLSAQTVAIEASSTMDMKATGVTTIKGSVVKIN